MELFLFWLLMSAVVGVIASTKGFTTWKWVLYGLAIWPVALAHVAFRKRRD